MIKDQRQGLRNACLDRDKCFTAEIVLMLLDIIENKIEQSSIIVAHILSENGFHITMPNENGFDDVARRRWEVCLKITEALKE